MSTGPASLPHRLQDSQHGPQGSDQLDAAVVASLAEAAAAAEPAPPLTQEGLQCARNKL